jgi:hypothetical protein
MNENSESYQLQTRIPAELRREIAFETERQIREARVKEARSIFYSSIRWFLFIRVPSIALFAWLWPSYLMVFLFVGIVDIIEWSWKGRRFLRAREELRSWEKAKDGTREIGQHQSNRQVSEETKL